MFPDFQEPPVGDKAKMRAKSKEGDREDKHGLVVLELDMWAVLDTDSHANGRIRLWWLPKRMYPDISLFHDFRYPSSDRHPDVPIQGDRTTQQQSSDKCGV